MYLGVISHVKQNITKSVKFRDFSKEEKGSNVMIKG